LLITSAYDYHNIASSRNPSFFCFFFFQAEDGIRDRNVTGVQTCALPILKLPPTLHSGRQSSDKTDILATARAVTTENFSRYFERSEERRVGKECRCRRAPDERRETLKRDEILKTVYRK